MRGFDPWNRRAAAKRSEPRCQNGKRTHMLQVATKKHVGRGPFRASRFPWPLAWGGGSPTHQYPPSPVSSCKLLSDNCMGLERIHRALWGPVRPRGSRAPMPRAQIGPRRGGEGGEGLGPKHIFRFCWRAWGYPGTFGNIFGMFGSGLNFELCGPISPSQTYLS